MKKVYGAGFVLVFVLVLTVSLVLIQGDSRTAATRQFESLSAAEHSVNSRFFTVHRAELEWIAHQDEVKKILREKGSESPELVRLLQEANGLLGLDAVSLVSTDGKVVVASRPGLVGTDLSDQRAIRAGIAGKPCYALGVGVATKTRGIYASLPVWTGGHVIGIVSFRTNADLLDKTFDHFPYTFVLDPQNRVFSNSPSLNDFVAALWTWDGANRVRIQDQWYRVSRYPLDAVPGYVLVSLEKETWPWLELVIVDLLLILAIATGFSVWQQIKLVRERAAESAARRQRETLLANLLEGIAVLDRTEKIVWTNPAFERLAQLEPGKPVPVLTDLWDSPSGGGAPWQQVLDGTQTEVVFEAVLRGQQGGWTPVIAGFTIAGGQYLLSVLDRSERHRSDQLLRHSQKLTVLGQLAGGVAHDLNNMLGVLMGMTDLLKMTLSEQDPLQESVDLMLTTLARAASLSEKMLNFARQTPLVKVSLDVTALLRELRFLARTALPEMVSATVETPAGPLYVQGDENLLLSALLNLILNAGEAMEGAGTVVVTGEVRESGQFKITVKDHGRGMDQETLGRIFEPFFSTKQSQKGTGLGLSLVRRTILEHEGSIQVESTPGVGTSVMVTLPLVG